MKYLRNYYLIALLKEKKIKRIIAISMKFGYLKKNKRKQEIINKK